MAAILFKQQLCSFLFFRYFDHSKFFLTTTWYYKNYFEISFRTLVLLELVYMCTIF